jgi:hypothetical protein
MRSRDVALAPSALVTENRSCTGASLGGLPMHDECHGDTNTQARRTVVTQ